LEDFNPLEYLAQRIKVIKNRMDEEIKLHQLQEEEELREIENLKLNSKDIDSKLNSSRNEHDNQMM